MGDDRQCYITSEISKICCLGIILNDLMDKSTNKKKIIFNSGLEFIYLLK